VYMKKILRDIEIGYKLMASFILIAALTVFIGVYAIQSLKNLEERTRIMYERGAVPLGLFVSTADEMNKLALQARNWRLSKTDEGRNNALKILDETHSNLKNLISTQKEMVLAANGKEVLDNLLAAIDKYVLDVRAYTNATKERCPLSGITTADFSSSILESEIKMIRALEDAKETRVHAIRNLADQSSAEYLIDRVLSDIILFVVVVLSLTIGSYLTLSITKPIRRFGRELSKIEKGDMTVRIGLKGDDELGMLAKSIDSLVKRLHDFFIDLQKDSEILANSAEEFSYIGKNVLQTAEKAMEKTAIVACSTEQASVNVNTVAAAIEEMSVSVGQISNKAVDANKVIDEASGKSSNATGAVERLDTAAKEIGQVTKAIKSIADKTNILALNATIEAASAGSAGKGFAVVAGEIKELANQSARSADDIARRVEGIRASTGEASLVISGVSDVISKINNSVASISHLIDQQTKISNEIAKNTSEVARGISVVSQSVIGIAQEAKDGAQGSKQVNNGADELAKMALNLKKALSQFRV